MTVTRAPGLGGESTRVRPAPTRATRPRRGQPPIGEAALQTNVIDLCRTLHILVAHFRPAKTEKGWRTPVAADGAGFPDLVMVGRSGVLYRELKGPHGVVSADQQAWLTALTTAGADAAVWWPGDWPQRVEVELRAIAGRPRRVT